MNYLPLASLLPLTAVIGAFSASAGTPEPTNERARNVAVTLSPDLPRETVLLVSLEDGSVIMQTIISNADLCFKKNSASSTICLTKGAPVYDPDTEALIGYEMIEEHIDLVAKSD